MWARGCFECRSGALRVDLLLPWDVVVDAEATWRDEPHELTPVANMRQAVQMASRWENLRIETGITGV